MSLGKITDTLKTGKILVSDGAWGTMLHKMGLKPGECPELWCADRFESVAEIARLYAEAGADMVQTNSLGSSRIKLEHYGLGNRASEINEAAAKASRAGAGEKWVIASVGPTGKLLLTEEITEQELYVAFAEQISALEKGGADAICIETMSDIDEALCAVRAAKETTSLEVICTFTFEKTPRLDFRTIMGASPSQAACAAFEAGADIVGANCGNGIAGMIEVVREIRAALPTIPILVHANAGLPQISDGKVFFPETPEDMAKAIRELANSGANIIGGCCGTTPDHIKAIREQVDLINAG